MVLYFNNNLDIPIIIKNAKVGVFQDSKSLSVTYNSAVILGDENL